MPSKRTERATDRKIKTLAHHDPGEVGIVRISDPRSSTDPLGKLLDPSKILGAHDSNVWTSRRKHQHPVRIQNASSKLFCHVVQPLIWGLVISRWDYQLNDGTRAKRIATNQAKLSFSDCASTCRAALPRGIMTDIESVSFGWKARRANGAIKASTNPTTNIFMGNRSKRRPKLYLRGGELYVELLVSREYWPHMSVWVPEWFIKIVRIRVNIDGINRHIQHIRIIQNRLKKRK